MVVHWDIADSAVNKRIEKLKVASWSSNSLLNMALKSQYNYTNSAENGLEICDTKDPRYPFSESMRGWTTINGAKMDDAICNQELQKTPRKSATDMGKVSDWFQNVVQIKTMQSVQLSGESETKPCMCIIMGSEKGNLFANVINKMMGNDNHATNGTDSTASLAAAESASTSAAI